MRVLADMSKVLLVSACVSLTPTIALPGAVKPLWNWLFKLATTLVEAMENGAVPVDTLETICELYVHAPEMVQARFAAQNVFVCGDPTRAAASNNRAAVRIFLLIHLASASAFLPVAHSFEFLLEPGQRHGSA